MDMMRVKVEDTPSVIVLVLATGYEPGDIGMELPAGTRVIGLDGSDADRLLSQLSLGEKRPVLGRWSR